MNANHPTLDSNFDFPSQPTNTLYRRDLLAHWGAVAQGHENDGYLKAALRDVAVPKNGREENGWELECDNQLSLRNVLLQGQDRPAYDTSRLPMVVKEVRRRLRAGEVWTSTSLSDH
jgi:hypothetical protein